MTRQETKENKSTNIFDLRGHSCLIAEKGHSDPHLGYYEASHRPFGSRGHCRPHLRVQEVDYCLPPSLSSGTLGQLPAGRENVDTHPVRSDLRRHAHG